MAYYPVFLDIRDRKCLVIGGGEVAQRKISSLLECGAEVLVVSPRLTPGLQELVSRGQIHWIAREYHSSDLHGVVLAISATNDRVVNSQVAEEASFRGVMLNVVDDPDRCSFIVPALVRRGDLVIAISTGGASPILARKVRERLENIFGDEYGEFLKIMAELRPVIGHRYPCASKRRRIFERLVESDLLELLKQGKTDLVKERIEQCISLP